MKRIYLAVLVAAAATAPVAVSAEWVQQGTSMQPFQIASASQMAGKVVETMDAGSYTYVSVDTGSQVIWAAAPQFAVEVGDQVSIPPGSLMQNYHSKTLDRTFGEVYFVNAVNVEGGTEVRAGGMTAAYGDVDAANKSHAGTANNTQPSTVDLSGIAKPDGGKTIGEIFDGRSALSDKEVLVRAKVVKFSPHIMKTNWIHLQDATSGSGGENDLTVTTAGTAEVGDTVLVRGKITLDKDFGFGYKWDVMIEDAEVTIE